MTTERDFDRLAHAWLELGPDEAPERTVAAILQATETMPQKRRRLRWPTRRAIQMNRLPVLVGAWLAVLLTVVGVSMLNRPDQVKIGTPTNPSASSSRAPTASATDVQVDGVAPVLISQWLGDRRPITEISLDNGARLFFTSFGTGYLTESTTPTDPLLYSAASTQGGTLRLVTGSGQGAGCDIGAVGTYTWSVSPSGRTLSIAGQTDDCIPRLASFAGTWWRNGCLDRGNDCLGDVDAGRYRSSFVEVRPARTDAFTSIYGNVIFTVPDGWANTADWSAGLILMPSADYAASSRSSAPIHQVAILAHPVIAKQDAACSAANEPAVGRTVDAMMGSILASPGLRAANYAPVIIDGHQGQMFDLTLAPSWNGVCPDMGGLRSAPVIRQADTDGGGWDMRISAAERWKLILLDLDGTAVAIVIDDSESQARFDDLVTQAMPVVQSLHFP